MNVKEVACGYVKLPLRSCYDFCKGKVIVLVLFADWENRWFDLGVGWTTWDLLLEWMAGWMADWKDTWVAGSCRRFFKVWASLQATVSPEFIKENEYYIMCPVFGKNHVQFIHLTKASFGLMLRSESCTPASAQLEIRKHTRCMKPFVYKQLVRRRPVNTWCSGIVL